MKDIDLKKYSLKDKKEFILGIVELLKLTELTPLKIEKLKEVIKFYELKEYEEYFIDSLYKNFNVNNIKKIRFYEIILYFEFMQINDFKREEYIENIFEKIFESNLILLNESLEQYFFDLISRFENDQDKLLKICINFGLGYLEKNDKILEDKKFILKLMKNEKIKIPFLKHFHYILGKNTRLHILGKNTKLKLLIIETILSNLIDKDFVDLLIRQSNLENNTDLAFEILKKYPNYYNMFDEKILFDERVKNVFLDYFNKKNIFNLYDIDICEIYITKEDSSFFKKILLKNINKLQLENSYFIGNFIVLHYIVFQDKDIIEAVNKSINLSKDDINYILQHSKDKEETLKKLFFNEEVLQNLDKEAKQNKSICLKLIRKNFENIFYIDENLKKEKTDKLTIWNFLIHLFKCSTSIKDYLDILNPNTKNIKNLELLNQIEKIPIECFRDEHYIKLLDKTLLNSDEYLLKLIEKLKLKNNLDDYEFYNIISNLENLTLSTIYKIMDKFNYYNFNLLNIKRLNKNKKFILHLLEFAPSSEIDLNLIDKTILDEKFILDIIKILKKRDLKFRISKRVIKPFLNNDVIFKEFIKANYFSNELIFSLNRKHIISLLQHKNLSDGIKIIKNMKKNYRNDDFIKKIIKYKPDELKYTNFDLRDNEETVFFSIRYYSKFIKYASKRIKNKKFITSCLRNDILYFFRE